MGRTVTLGTIDVSEQGRHYVLDAIDRKRLSPGPHVARFEQKFAAEHDCRFAVACNSGTSALQVSLAALRERHGWADGDEVIVPALTFIATSNVVLHAGLRVRFVDVDPHSYNLDPALLEATVGPRTRAVIPVHLFGQPCDMAPILEIAARHGLAVLEDSCQTMFTRYRGHSIGAFGELACFSTYVAHPLSTGTGGIITTNDLDLDRMCRSLVAHGRNDAYLSIDDDDGLSGHALRRIVESRFSFVRLGYSFRWNELEAGLGLDQLERAEEIIGRHRHVAQLLIKRLRPLDDVLQLPSWPEHSDHSFMVFPLVVRGPIDREALVMFLEERGIETRPMFPLLSQPVYRERFGELELEFPTASWLARAGFYVGCHQHMNEEDVAYLGDVLEQYFAQRDDGKENVR